MDLRISTTGNTLIFPSTDIFMRVRRPCFFLSLGDEREEGSGKREGEGKGAMKGGKEKERQGPPMSEVC